MTRIQFGIGMLALGLMLFMFQLGASTSGSSQSTSPVVAQYDGPSEPQVIKIEPIQIEVTVKYPDLPPEPIKVDVEVAQAPIVVQTQPVVVPSTVAPVQVAPSTPTPITLYRVTRPTTPTPYIKPVVIAPVQPVRSTNTPVVLSTPYQATGIIRTDPCANRLCTMISINFTGAAARSAVNTTCNVARNSTALACLQQAIGSNMQTKDFGGSLGIFVEGLYGVKPSFASCSCYWEFVVNGQSSNEGVSTYQLKQGDSIGFRIAK